jgi:hypothetical protein
MVNMQANFMHSFILATTTPQCNLSSLSNSAQCLPITPFTWVPFAVIAALLVVMVAVIIYMLSNIIKSDNAKNWARFQIYEVLLSVLLIVAFASITYLFFLNPQTAFTQLNLVPQSVTFNSPVSSVSVLNLGSIPIPTSNTVTAIGCTGATQLFSLASCDLSVFNNATFAFAGETFYATYVTAAIPSLQYNPIKALSNDYFKMTWPGLIPSGSDQIVGLFFDSLMTLVMINQIQLIVISGSVLFLSFFLAIGLISRTLGFTRTFGGAMIAFGIGIGIIYPLLVALTYGYIDVSVNAVCIQYYSCSFGTVIAGMFSIFFGTSALASYSVVAGNLFLDIGYLVAGLLFIPLLNFAIVDAFVIDFSSAIGERMSFGELFSNFI